jgi:peroxiredoxin
VSAATESQSLSAGDRAPDFTLKSVGLKEVSLRDFRGKKNVVLLFYPLDWTPG